jgi:hypothetical protein
MTQFSNKFVLSAAALAVSALLAACGGGEAGPPPDVVAPTLAITDNVSETTATGPVTFTFTFSEDVGSSFTAEDIVVTGGTASAFTKVNAVNYTLVVTPAENSSGTINVNVAADKFMDLSSNANTAASTAAQAYNTVVVTPPPAGTGTLLISWDEEPPIFTGMGAYGDALPSVDPAPAGGTGKALKILKPATAPVNWGGVYFGTPTVPFTADRKTLTARVYSTRAGAVIRLKVEIAGVDGSGVEVAANEVTGAANTWTTLTWNLAGVDPTKSYNVFAITPDPDVQVSGQSYWIEDITLAAAAGGGGGDGGSVACGTTEPTCAPTTSIPGDALVIYSDAASVAGLDLAPDWGQGGSITRSEATIAGNKSQKYVFTDPALLYQGITWGSPQNVSGKATLKLDVWSAGATSIKVSLISPGPLENAVTKTLTAGTWNSLSIDLSQYNIPNLSEVFQIKLEPSAVGAIYVDNIHFAGTASGGGGGGTVTPPGGLVTLTNGVFASNYRETPTPWSSVEGGTAGRYVDDSVPVQDWWSGLAANDSTPSFYFGYGTNVNSKPWGFGAYVSAPNNGVANVSPYSNLRVSVWGNDQLMATAPTLTVILKGATVGGCTSELKGNINASGIGVQTYTVPLSSFTLQTACAYASAAAALAGGVSQVHIQVLGDELQYTAGGDGNGNFPNGLNIGPMSFN